MVHRNDIDYNVQVFNEADKTGRYSIVVKNKSDPSDTDWMALPQITLFMDELKNYLKRNLRIYQKPDGRIDYLSLANDQKIFNKTNKARVTQSLSQARDGTSSYRSASIQGDRIDTVGSSQREPLRLSQSLNEFEIERNGKNYKVNVHERKN